VRDLDRAQERARDDREQLEALRDRRDETPWYRRAERRDLDHFIDARTEGLDIADARVDELRDSVERLIDDPPPPPRGIPAHEPLAQAHWLDRAAELDFDMGVDL
jgi:hypothetical protein